MASDTIQTGPVETPSPPSGKERQAAAAKSRICAAVIACLDELGYAETSINRIQERAKVSRGALTHHFPTKEDLIVETAERLLHPALNPKLRPPDARPRTLEEELVWTWVRLVDTPEGRALFEILAAARTDAALKARISDRFKAWNDDLNDVALKLFEAPAGDADARALWTICRVFVRGLTVQKQFEKTEEDVEDLVRRFASLIAPHLSPRGKAGEA